MHLTITKHQDIEHWYIASGKDFQGRNIFGAGSTVLEAITNALNS